MLTTIVAGAFVLGVVVLVHEFGHFIVAKLAGVFVKTFSIGFGKKILRFRVGETVYALSLLPFGGYVKFAGETDLYDDDELGTEDGEKEEGPSGDDEVPDSEIPPERYFTRQGKWVRAAVLFAGPLMNYILAVFLYVGVFFVQGVQVVPDTRLGAVIPGSVADSVGLATGDVILSVGGAAVSDWSDMQNALAAAHDTTVAVSFERAGETREVDFRAQVTEGRISLGVAPYIAPVIGRVQKGKPAHQAGIRAGAVIESVNDTAINSFYDVRELVSSHPGEAVYVRWRHDNIAYADSIVPEPNEEPKQGSTTEFVTVGTIGIWAYTERERESFGASLASGFSTANRMVAMIVIYLKALVSGQMGVKSLGGPILITQMAGDVANWGFDYLLLFLAFFNINLCIFNLMPVLPFDGGHLAILGVEGLMRRPLNRRLRGWMNQGGFVLVILLMLFVVFLDLSRCSGVTSRF